jgi:GNAT superfamily N-acetyltransferase
MTGSEAMGRSPQPIIRRATLDDAAALSELRWLFHSEDHPTERESLDAFTDQFGAFLGRVLGREWEAWVAEQDGRLISNMYVQTVEKPPRPGRPHAAFAYVSNVYTRPEWRGRGVGGQVLDALIAWARGRRLEFLVLWPSEASPPFYERHGFRRSADALELHL